MIRDLYHYELLSPMHAGTRKPYGRFMECADHVPGSVVRGACAEVILRCCPNRRPGGENPDCPRNTDQCPAWDGQSRRCLFGEVFVGDDALLFTHAYVIPRIENASFDSRPAPLTLRQCSHFPGSPADYRRRLEARSEHDDVEFADPPHGLWDTLISGYVLEHREREALATGKLPAEGDAAQEAVDHGGQCPQCGHKAERVPGYLVEVWRPHGDRYWMAHSPSKERRVHVALNRSRRSAEIGLLFSRESVQRGTTFRGQVIGGENRTDLMDVVRRALAPRSREPLVFGRGGAAGMGHVAATLMAPPSDDDLATRLMAFNDAVQAALPAPGQTYFAIDALAPLLVTPVPETDWEATLQLPDVQVLRRVQALTSVSGWSSMPDRESFGERQTYVAVAAGSVFLCVWKGQVDELARHLAPWEESGVGKWCTMGYGRIEFSSSVHLMAPADIAVKD